VRLLKWLFGELDYKAQCGNKEPHESHFWYMETGPDNGYGFESDQYHCEGVK
jgi:hypothetical protein